MFLSQRVLIASTNEELRRKLYEKLLDREVFSDTVVDSHGAIEKLGQVPYALILLDVSQTALDSLAILNFASSLPVKNKPVVIGMLSGEPTAAIDHELVQVIIRRPFNLPEIADVVQSCVRAIARADDARGSQQEPDAPPPPRDRADA